MASLIGKLAGFARSPQGRKLIGQATTKAQELAKDPATRAKLEQGAARVRAEVDKRRTPPSSTPTTPPTSPPSTPPSTPPGA